ncbi:hypothetical protein [Paralysiella testudinis]|uniref:Uncharacterized protein n=1 Tax=Paralysiella testudinis TaxID=2809020 RepID=A0A892ZGS4_9NEIS|nr:hypothetical protein [Paralysiella testudinis]QRQ81843.1 hypothetical protein JQU52_14480 [Paralysiella testudinis]
MTTNTLRRKNLTLRWLLVCLLPAATIAFFLLNPPASPLRHLINGIVLVCEAVFLLKWVLFEAIGHHLKQEHALKRQTLWLLLPISLLAAYCVFYFVA